jgi:acyl carrier protein
MDTKHKIREYFSKAISLPLGDTDDFFEMGLVDSLFALQLVLFVENEFQLHVEGEDLDLDNFCTINAVERFVAKKLATTGN